MSYNIASTVQYSPRYWTTKADLPLGKWDSKYQQYLISDSKKTLVYSAMYPLDCLALSNQACQFQLSQFFLKKESLRSNMSLAGLALSTALLGNKICWVILFPLKFLTNLILSSNLLNSLFQRKIKLFVWFNFYMRLRKRRHLVRRLTVKWYITYSSKL